VVDYILTKHARKRLDDRKVSVRLVEDALLYPTQLLADGDGDGKWLYKKLYAGEKKLRMLMLVVIMEGSRLKILTIIDTSKVKKYLKIK